MARIRFSGGFRWAVVVMTMGLGIAAAWYASVQFSNALNDERPEQGNRRVEADQGSCQDAGLTDQLDAVETKVRQATISIVLFDITHDSIQASVTSSAEVVGRLEYAREEHSLLQYTPIQHLQPGVPTTFTMHIGPQPVGRVLYEWVFADPAFRNEFENVIGPSGEGKAFLNRSGTRWFSKEKSGDGDDSAADRGVP